MSSGGSPDLGAPPVNPDLLVAAQQDPQLSSRTIDYGLALRTAAVKLVGDLPTLDEQNMVAAASDQKTAYGAQIDTYMADPRFTDRLIAFFRDTFKMGGQLPVGNMMNVSLETAPTFAAEVAVNDRPFTDILTASTNTCPTYGNGQFTDASCTNMAQTSGVLTDPGAMAQFVSNMAFRRTRWVQETFDCRRFPTEYSQAPVAMGAGQYSSPWPFDSIAGGTGAAIDFHDTSSVVCANCHTTINHIAPLFGNFDGKGMFQTTIQVTTPIKGLPKTKMTDWLPAGETTSWRFGVAVTDIPSLGQAMAKDPEVTSCMVVRLYDWAMSKDDVVVDLATVPDPVLAPYLADFTAGGMKIKHAIRTMFTSDDFVKF
jgi:hypothetical protein